MRNNRLLLFLFSLTAFQVGLCASLASAATQVWMGPVGFTTDQRSFPLEPTSLWSRTLNTIAALDMPLVPLATWHTDAQRRALAATLKSSHVQLVATTRAIDPSLCTDAASLASIGQVSAASDFEKLKVWLNAGGSVSVLVLDGPVHRVLYSPNCERLEPTLEMAARQIALYLTTMTRLLAQVGQPRPRFHIIVNFPNWDFEGLAKPFHGQNFKLDYSTVLEQVVGVARDNGVPFEALEIDNGKPFPLGERVRRLVQKTRGLGLQIGMIFNTYNQTRGARPKNCSRANGCNPRQRDYMPPDDLREQTFLSDMLSLIAEWRSTIGAPPDYAIIMSWMMHPRSILPETTFGTLSYDVLAAQKALDGSMPPIFAQRAAPVGSVRAVGDRLVGWAYDPDEPVTSIYVHIYKDVPASPGQFSGFVASIAADEPSDEPNGRLGIAGRHGFSWQIPQNLLRERHTWYVYSADVRPGTLASPGRPGTLIGPGPLAPLGNSPIITFR